MEANALNRRPVPPVAGANKNARTVGPSIFYATQPRKASAAHGRLSYETNATSAAVVAPRVTIVRGTAAAVIVRRVAIRAAAIVVSGRRGVIAGARPVVITGLRRCCGSRSERQRARGHTECEARDRSAAPTRFGRCNRNRRKRSNRGGGQCELPDHELLQNHSARQRGM